MTSRGSGNIITIHFQAAVCTCVTIVQCPVVVGSELECAVRSKIDGSFPEFIVCVISHVHIGGPTIEITHKAPGCFQYRPFVSGSICLHLVKSGTGESKVATR